jgi:hypothetical protein
MRDRNRVLGRLAQAARADRPVLRISVPPRLARFLIAAGARPAAAWHPSPGSAGLHPGSVPPEHLPGGSGNASRSAELATLTERSGLLAQLAVAAGEAESDVSPLLLGIARREIERLTGFMQNLLGAGSIAYDGEDREWLLALTREATVSLDAVSLSSVAEAVGGGLWTSDLGARYLQAQHEAIGRKVAIRRVFVFENEGLALDEAFLDITQTQRDLGIQVRMLDHQLIPGWLRPMIADFIVFDRSLGYEITTPTAFHAVGAGGTRPAVMRTMLTTVPSRIQVLQKQFEELWQAADPERKTATGDPGGSRSGEQRPQAG